MNKNIPLPQQEDNAIWGNDKILFEGEQSGAYNDENKCLHQAFAGKETFVLKTGAYTSAGVYNSIGKLVRTLRSKCFVHPQTWQR